MHNIKDTILRSNMEDKSMGIKTYMHPYRSIIKKKCHLIISCISIHPSKELNCQHKAKRCKDQNTLKKTNHMSAKKPLTVSSALHLLPFNSASVPSKCPKTLSTFSPFSSRMTKGRTQAALPASFRAFSPASSRKSLQNNNSTKTHKPTRN